MQRDWQTLITCCAFLVLLCFFFKFRQGGYLIPFSCTSYFFVSNIFVLFRKEEKILH